jgi:hypothetical protein
VHTIMKQKPIRRVEVNMGEMEEILKRARAVLSPEDYEKLQAAVDTLEFLTQEIEGKNASIRRLRDLLFGPTSEKYSIRLESTPTPPRPRRAAAPVKGPNLRRARRARRRSETATVAMVPRRFGGRIRSKYRMSR